MQLRKIANKFIIIGNTEQLSKFLKEQHGVQVNEDQGTRNFDTQGYNSYQLVYNNNHYDLYLINKDFKKFASAYQKILLESLTTSNMFCIGLVDDEEDIIQKLTRENPTLQAALARVEDISTYTLGKTEDKDFLQNKFNSSDNLIQLIEKEAKEERP